MRRKIIVISLAIFWILAISLAIYVWITPDKEKILKQYHPIVITEKNTKLVDSKNKEVGSIEKGVTLLLEEINQEEVNSYFKIKDTDLYIYYKDINEASMIVTTPDEMPWNEFITIEGMTTFYTKDNQKIELSTPLSLPIYEKDENSYTIWYLNQKLKVEKSQNIKVNIYENGNQNAESISVLYYKEVADNCSKTDCVSKNTLTKHMNLLKEQEYHSITINQYKKWLEGKILIPKKAILLLSDSIIENDDFKFEIKTNNDITFHENNLPTTLKEKSPNAYKMTTSLSQNQFHQIMNGDAIEISVASAIPVINYHFFYDSRLNESCNEGICLDMIDFEKQIEYLLQNDYKTLTMEEFKAWQYGEIELPKKSVLLTIDDGALGTGTHNGNKLIPTLEKYDIYATLFLISGWWGKENYISSHLNVESHTHNMHTEGVCKSQTRGAQMLCSTKQQVLEDLKQSIETLNTNTAFCFPFYASNDIAISAVKESGFKIAFIGGNYKATRNQNHYQIPRYPILKSTTLEQFKKMVEV